jgi:hypothetical protein
MPATLLRRPAAAVALALVAAGVGTAQPAKVPPLELFFRAAAQDERESDAALAELETVWKDSYTSMIIDMARMMRPARRAPGPTDEPVPTVADEETGMLPSPFGDTREAPMQPPHPSSLVRARLTRFLEKQTGKRFGDDLGEWRQWMWQLPYDPHPDYAAFKREVYAQIDPLMRHFFPPGVRSVIRLDEVDWGGIEVNGIPPLEDIDPIPAREATYLKDDHVVFGVVVNGQARAYPKRILAWHEMALDSLGGVNLAVVYCTLCGTVIPYDRRTGDVVRRFGTSGLLYQSNKLMFDEQSLSLWSALEGRPVLGPLAGSDIRLTFHPVVTTTWGEWRREHPETTVLPLSTGYKRDYSEGAAYRDYFSRDTLMFGVSKSDRRLKNKAEVLAVRLEGSGAAPVRVAIAADLLERNPVYPLEAGGRRLVVVTSREGANRVYEARDTTFTGRERGGRVQDSSGGAWVVTEDALVREADGERRARIPAHRAFWFGWYAQFPDTILIK